MQGDHILIHELISEHELRVMNLKKYYPYFKLSETSFGQYREGRYSVLDMGYLVMALLRFFIEENNFKEKSVTYGEYEHFIITLITRDFDLKLSEEEGKELAEYLFDKVRNEGKPFTCEYYDPADKKRKTLRTRLIDSRLEGESVVYFITADAIEFYLDTKEMKEESSINIDQLLLEKLIRSQNFKGGTDVVRRINNEVSRLKSKKEEVVKILSFDIFEGMKAYEEFNIKGMRWFTEEQKLFQKNKELLELMLDRARREGVGALEDIFQLDLELKKAIQKHSELLAASMDLQMKADEMIHRTKLSRLRSTFDYGDALSKVMEKDGAELLEFMVHPFFGLNLHKAVAFPMMEELLSYPGAAEEVGEVLTESGEQEVYVFEDEQEDGRIQENYVLLFEALLEEFLDKEDFTLQEWSAKLEEKLGQQVLKNADYYSFLIHLNQKKEYNVHTILERPETFLEELLHAELSESAACRKKWQEKYAKINFHLTRIEVQKESEIPNMQSMEDVWNRTRLAEPEETDTEERDAEERYPEETDREETDTDTEETEEIEDTDTENVEKIRTGETSGKINTAVQESLEAKQIIETEVSWMQNIRLERGSENNG